MSIRYRSEKSSFTLQDFLQAEDDDEKLKVALRLITESYDVHHFKLTRIPPVSLIGYNLSKPIDWRDIVPDALPAIISSTNAGTECYVKMADCSNGICIIFTKNGYFIAMGKIYDFKWIEPPPFHFWSTDYHYYIETEAELKRHITEMTYKKLTNEDIEKTKKHDEDKYSDSKSYIFIMPGYRDKNLIRTEPVKFEKISQEHEKDSTMAHTFE